MNCLFKEERSYDIKVLDCTIRDGGLVNNFHFTHEFVKAAYNTAIISGVDYFEIGKIVSPTLMSTKEFGPWNFCNESDLRKIVDNKQSKMKIAVMADIGRTLKEEILPKKESVIDLIRVACYIHQIDEAIEIVEDSHKKGYETSINLMAVSKISEEELDGFLSRVSKSNVDIIYIVDSFGTFHSREIRLLVNKYLTATKNNGKKLGIHAHNNQQLAYSNTIESMDLGVTFIDATIAGLGRGAGNCPLELLFGYLKNSDYYIFPVLKFIREHITELKNQISWGYDIPYMLTGQFNQHPKTAISFNKEGKTDYTQLYDDLMVVSV
ncbi:MAG: aldolase catalytic domain-containing protein [Spirochaetales bacterium]|nr:aldolase catalytic domain-containing protein [Spirochaetales bacterium]